MLPMARPSALKGLALKCLGLRSLAVLALACAVTAGASSAVLAQANSVTGLPVPRFVSLKADKVNVRQGPNRNHDVAWVFSRAGLPVEVTAEFETWRRIRDSDGAEGWVYHSMLSSRRTALIAPWKKDGTVPLRTEPSENAKVVAQLEPGVLGTVRECDSKFCRIKGDGYEGFVPQSELFGVYPGEKIE